MWPTAVLKWEHREIDRRRQTASERERVSAIAVSGWKERKSRARSQQKALACTPSSDYRAINQKQNGKTVGALNTYCEEVMNTSE